jgi:hypothetical protein
MNLLGHLPPNSHLRQSVTRELRAVFPSTTAVALTTIAAAAWPYRHGITGWWTHLPPIGRTVAILPFVERGSGAPFHRYDTSAREIIQVPTAWRSSLRDVSVILPPMIVPGSYNSWFHDGVRRVRRRRPDRVAKAVRGLIRHGHGPTLTYVYLPDVDHAAHRYGPASEESAAAAQLIEDVVAQIRARVPAGTRIVVTADHGHTPTPTERETVIGPAHDLMQFLNAPPSGDVRSVQFFVKSRYRRDFPDRLADALGEEHFHIVSTDELIDMKLLGPGAPTDRVRERWGDFTIIGRDDNSFEYVPEGDKPKAFIGSHSGLSPEEMRVPLILTEGVAE